MPHQTALCTWGTPAIRGSASGPGPRGKTSMIPCLLAEGPEPTTAPCVSPLAIQNSASHSGYFQASAMCPGHAKPLFNLETRQRPQGAGLTGTRLSVRSLVSFETGTSPSKVSHWQRFQVGWCLVCSSDPQLRGLSPSQPTDRSKPANSCDLIHLHPNPARLGGRAPFYTEIHPASWRF